MGKSTFLTVIMLFPLNFISAMAMDMYIPSIPDLLVLWPDKALWVQGSLGIFILAVGLGQIVVGPLSDALGRLKIIYSGFFLYISASVLTALSPSAEWLVGARFIQGMGRVVVWLQPMRLFAISMKVSVVHR
nr:MFS transporter [Piscirickettsia salmonis]